MLCSEVKDLIQLYMDSELDCRSTLELQRHIETCSVCSKTLEGFTTQDRSLKEAARSVAVNTAAVRQRVTEAIRSQTAPSASQRLLPRFWKQITAIAAIAAALILVFLFAQRLPGVDSTAYAAELSGHIDHCSADPKLGGITDTQQLAKLVLEGSGISALPDLSAFGYDGCRGRICKLGDRRFAHLVFFCQDQRMVSVFLGPHISPWADGQPRVVESSGGKITTIGRPNIDVIVVTASDEHRANQIAQTIASLH